jgi:hypothetical protein
VIGFIKGKSAIYIARRYAERKRNFAGHSFWARNGVSMPRSRLDCHISIYRRC